MRKVCLLLFLLLLPVLSAFAQNPNYGSGFTSTTGLTLNGFNGAAPTNGSALRLTDGGSSEGRSAFFNVPVNVQSFTNNFNFLLTNANADGFTFTIQNSSAQSAALGARGGGLGYTNISATSVAVGFQLYSSVLGFKPVSLTGHWTGGAAPDANPGTSMTGSGIDLHAGHVMSVQMTYDGTTLAWTIKDVTTSATFTQSLKIDIPGTVGSTAYVGFTGGDGGLTAVQDILSWTYTPGSNSPVPPSITTQPANQTVSVGQPATFSVVASGTAPLSYQWLQNTGGSAFAPISGANSSSYTTPATTSNNNGNTYEVTVSNSANPTGVTSNPPAILTVTSSAPGINYGSGFTSAGLVLNPATAPATINGTRLRLTDGGSGEGRSAFFNTPVNVQSFVNDFKFQLTNATADGFTFTIQGVGPTALGWAGGGLGYTNIGSNSVAVGFQLYSSALGNVSLTGHWTNGNAPDKMPGTDTRGSGVNLHSGDVMSVHMTYDGSTLTWTIKDTVTGATFTQSVTNINIPQLLNGSTTAYVGFTGGDGGLTSVQEILSWTYSPGSGGTAQVATPMLNPTTGTYSSTQMVTISDATSGATIFYTTNGTTPTTSSTQYTGPITVSSTTTIEAIATASGLANSSAATATYTIQSSGGGGSVATPTFSPVAGTYSSAQTVTISDTTAGATIYYTTDGSTPTTSSTQYTGPITVSNTTTIEAIAAASGMTNSSVAMATYTIQAGGGAPPSFGSGFFTPSGLTVNNGAAIVGSARLRLTDGSGSEKRSAFFGTPVNVQSFVSTFTFQLANANADGFTFTIQNNSAAALGNPGGGLGYAGIPNSVAVGFQLYSSGSNPPEVNLIGLWKNGQSPDSAPGTDMSGAPINLHSGDIFKVIISYDGTAKTLSAYIRDLSNNGNSHFFRSFPIDIPTTIGGSTAYVGFTGGEGGLTAIQDILSWSYNNSSTGTSGTFIWPVDPPAVVGANDYSSTAFGGQYHTGIDLCPGTAGCKTGDPVYATADGTVVAVLVTSDPAQTMCDGTTTGALARDNNHLGNTVIIGHSNGKFSLYGNIDCVWPGIAPNVVVSQHQRIGNIGNSQYGVRVNTWTPHIHFEIKDTGVLSDPATGAFASFTPDLPDGYGYHDPRLYIFPSSQNSSMSPTAVKVLGSPSLNVLTGPDTSYSVLNFVTTNQEFVAHASNGSWYQIDLPNSQGPISGWIPASAGSLILAAPDSAATKIQVTGSGTAGLLVRPSASAATNLVTWDNNSGFVINPTPDCTSTNAKIWDGQFFVTIANQNGFDEFYLPLNYYFSSGNSCVQPSSPGPSMGWASSTSLQ